MTSCVVIAWWRHQMDTFSALLAICAGNSPVMWSFDVFLDLRLNKRLSKQAWGWWFETPSCSLWRHCNDGFCTPRVSNAEKVSMSWRSLVSSLFPIVVEVDAGGWSSMWYRIQSSHWGYDLIFLAATKQLYEWYFLSVCPSVRLSVCPSVCPSVRLSVCPSVRLSHLFDYVPIIVSSWNFQELSHWTRVRSMQKVKVRGQRSRSQRSRPKFSFPDCNSSLNSHMMMKWYI